MSQDSPSPQELAEADVLASDVERDRVILRLNDAVSEGRLTLSEFSDRSAAVYAARKRSELADFVTDLPSPAAASASQLSPVSTGSALPGEEQLPIGAIKRSGRWRIPADSRLRVALGPIKLDLRDAELTAAEVTINASTGIGAIKVVVPEHVRLIVGGATSIGTRTVEENHLPVNVVAPTVHLRLDTGIGTVKVYVAKKSSRKRHYF